MEFSDWPGNIRQLASVCEEAVINARLEAAQEIEIHHLFPSSTAEPAETFQSARRQWEHNYLQHTLEKMDWNVAQTARNLGMSRSHLNALINKLGLKRG